MSSLGLYIFRQVIGPIVFFTVVLSGIIWLSQSLRMLDLVINKGQSAGTFAYLTLLTLPSLLAVVLPVAFLCACLYVVNRLYSDSELVVMWAAGVGRWRVLRPLLVAALLMSGISLLTTLYLMPAGMRTVKDTVNEIRADLVTTLVREGEFSNPIKGLTVYVKSQSGGELADILVHDSRKEDAPVTYMAAKARLERVEERLASPSVPGGFETVLRPQLRLFVGNVQTEDAQGNISILEFDTLPFDLSAFDEAQERAFREESERFIWELLAPDPKNEWEARETANFVAEGHARLSQPLYLFVFVLIAGAFLMSGTFSRRGQSLRIALAAVSGVITILIAYALKEEVAEAPELIPVLYLHPLAWIAGCAVAISRSRFGAAGAAPLPDDAAEPAR